MKIAVFGQIFKEEYKKVLVKLINTLEKKGVTLIFEEYFFEEIQKILNYNGTCFSAKDNLPKDINTLISIGGDGTMLRAASIVKDSGIPILGINTGRLGFLATIKIEELEHLINKFLNNSYSISQRNSLQITANPPIISPDFLDFALNEVTVSRKDTTSMIAVETNIDEEYLTTYWADGLIVATPTGSTGYSLSCGGPVVSPGANCFVITPIAPHNLNVRPLIIKDDVIIKLKVNGREDQNLVSLDSRIYTVPNDTEITIKKAPFKINLIEFENENFFKTLRKKLLWGEDKRN